MDNLDWKNLPFSYIKTDYNVRCLYRNGQWGELSISTSEYLTMHMAATSLHYGQAAIMTPSDFPFSRDGIAAEGIINDEQIVIADLDLDLLDENRLKGSTIPLMDKRQDIYKKSAVIEDTR